MYILRYFVYVSAVSVLYIMAKLLKSYVNIAVGHNNANACSGQLKWCQYKTDKLYL
jgi:hypothetical protein